MALHYVAGPLSWRSFWDGPSRGVAAGGPYRILDKNFIVLEVPFSGPFRSLSLILDKNFIVLEVPFSGPFRSLSLILDKIFHCLRGAI